MKHKTRMGSLLALADWHLRGIGRPLALLCAAMGPAELGLIALYLAHYKAQYMQLHQLFQRSGACYVLPAALVLALLLDLAAGRADYSRPRAIYTLMTLPVPRAWLYFSRVISGVLAVGCVAAAQALWYLLLYAPVTALSGLAGEPAAHAAFMTGGLWLNQMRSTCMALLLPAGPKTAACMAYAVVALVAIAEAVVVHGFYTGVLLGISAAYTAVWCVSRAGYFGRAAGGEGGLLIVLTVCLALAVLQACSALQGGENVPGGKLK